MTDSTIGIRGISPFAGTGQGRKRFSDRGGERSLAKHADVTDADSEAQESAQEPLSLAPGQKLDITV